MKNLLFFLLLFSSGVFGQSVTSVIAPGDEGIIVMFDSISNEIFIESVEGHIGNQHDIHYSYSCAERGHVEPDVVFSTAMYCPSYIEEDSLFTVRVKPRCNYITYDCRRCGKGISEQEREHRDTVWHKHQFTETIFKPCWHNKPCSCLVYNGSWLRCKYCDEKIDDDIILYIDGEKRSQCAGKWKK